MNMITSFSVIVNPFNNHTWWLAAQIVKKTWLILLSILYVLMTKHYRKQGICINNQVFASYICTIHVSFHAQIVTGFLIYICLWQSKYLPSRCAMAQRILLWCALAKSTSWYVYLPFIILVVAIGFMDCTSSTACLVQPFFATLQIPIKVAHMYENKNGARPSVDRVVTDTLHVISVISGWFNHDSVWLCQLNDIIWSDRRHLVTLCVESKLLNHSEACHVCFQ